MARGGVEQSGSLECIEILHINIKRNSHTNCLLSHKLPVVLAVPTDTHCPDFLPLINIG